MNQDIEKSLAAVIEPVVDEVVALSKRLDEIQLIPGENGQDGKDGEPGAPGQDADPKAVAKILVEEYQEQLTGKPGADGRPGEPGTPGLGIDIKSWSEGIHREGVFVTAELGRVYRALRDTAGEPGKSEDWERIGTAGFSWKGLKKEGVVYQHGDLYIDDGSTFIFWNGKSHLFCQRPAKGKQGDPGQNGINGKDAPIPIAVKYDMTGFHLVLDSGDVLSTEVDGMEDYIDTVATIKVANFLEDQNAQDLKFGTPVRIYRGTFLFSETYRPGDLVTYRKCLWLCTNETTPNQDITASDWVNIAGTMSGGGSAQPVQTRKSTTVPGFAAEANVVGHEMPVSEGEVVTIRGHWSDAGTTGKPGIILMDNKGLGIDLALNADWMVGGVINYSAGTIGAWTLEDARTAVSNIRGGLGAYPTIEVAEAVYAHSYKIEVDMSKPNVAFVSYEARYRNMTGGMVLATWQLAIREASQRLAAIRFFKGTGEIHWTATKD